MKQNLHEKQISEHYEKQAKREEKIVISLARKFAAEAANRLPDIDDEFTLREAFVKAICRELYQNPVAWSDVISGIYTDSEIADQFC